MMKVLPKFKSRVFLAPMMNITDPAFRLLCKKRGAGLVVTELISAHSVVANEFEIKKLIPFSKKEKPIAVQLFGSDISKLGRAVKIVEPFFDIIDYNMGCPSGKVVKNKSGAGLLNSPRLCKKIFNVLVNSTNKPVTLKLRTGVDEKHKYQFLKIAKIAEKCGVNMITLHARTLKQGYSGKADWNLIKKLKCAVGIPVVGNGDIFCPEDALRMIEETGCDYVMIGRGAKGNPFLFKQIKDYLKKGKYKEYSDEKRMGDFKKYLKLAKKFNIKFSLIKGQAMYFTKSVVGGKKLREKISRTKSVNELKKIIGFL